MYRYEGLASVKLNVAARDMPQTVVILSIANIFNRSIGKMFSKLE